MLIQQDCECDAVIGDSLNGLAVEILALRTETAKENESR